MTVEAIPNMAEILLVEDNTGGVRLIMEASKKNKICNNMNVVKDGVEAMAFLRREREYADAPRPDVILLDLPRKDGREVLVEIKADESLRSIPVIILTTSRRKEDVLIAANEQLKQEIRERQQMEETLRESEESLRVILDSILTGVVVIDAKTHVIVDANPIAVEIIGVPKARIIGRVCHSFICPSEVGKCPITDLGQTVDKSERVLINGNGERIPVIKTVSSIILNGRMYLIDSFIDITERKKTEDALHMARNELEMRVKERTAELIRTNERLQAEITDRRRTAEELARSNADLQKFVYVASHDLQEPLRMVASYLQLLERRYKGRLDDDADDFINYAVDGAIRVQRLINDLLTYSHVSMRSKDFELTDSEAVLEHNLSNLQMAIEESEAVVTHDPLPTVMADSTQLRQLLQNLISNAIKFHNEKPPRVHISARQEEGEWIFSVRDNGIGIDPDYRERIFVIFQRLHGVGEFTGTGIGLALCKKIVERHGGRIWVESQPGDGSTFYFTIPTHGR